MVEIWYSDSVGWWRWCRWWHVGESSTQWSRAYSSHRQILTTPSRLVLTYRTERNGKRTIAMRRGLVLRKGAIFKPDQTNNARASTLSLEQHPSIQHAPVVFPVPLA